MGKKFYRFRRVESLLGRNELQNQEIYFSDIDSLNDPMEGFHFLNWKGDAIAWKCLFRHYILCQAKLVLEMYFSKKQTVFSKNDISIESNLSHYFNFVGDFEKKIYQQIVDNFFSDKSIEKLLNIISRSNEPLGRDELLMYLSNINDICLKTIHDVLYDNKVEPRKIDFPFYKKSLNQIIGIFSHPQDDKENYETLRQARNTMADYELLNQVNSSNKNLALKFFLVNYSEYYLKKLEELIFPKWYISCFMTNYKNASIWGSYGGEHKGVCMIFESLSNTDNFSLKLKAHSKLEHIEPVKLLSLKKVNYQNQFEEINFFESLGVLNRTTISDTWLTFDNVKSSLLAGYQIPDKEWHDNYVSKFEKVVTTKLTDWKYEKEYRIIIQDSFKTMTNKKDRLLKYDFNSLKGLIFGINTSIEDKVRIIKIISSLCKENARKNFSFYQAYYCNLKKKITIRKLSLNYVEID